MSVERQPLKYILETLGLAGVLLQSHDRETVVLQYVVDEWHCQHFNPPLQW